jgi:hypothetical protein
MQYANQPNITFADRSFRQAPHVGALRGVACFDPLQVHAANDAVFEDIAAGFCELCSSLLPSLQLQLARTGHLAHEGLQFKCVAAL